MVALFGRFGLLILIQVINRKCNRIGIIYPNVMSFLVKCKTVKGEYTYDVKNNFYLKSIHSCI